MAVKRRAAPVVPSTDDPSGPGYAFGLDLLILEVSRQPLPLLNVPGPVSSVEHRIHKGGRPHQSGLDRGPRQAVDSSESRIRDYPSCWRQRKCPWDGMVL